MTTAMSPSMIIGIIFYLILVIQNPTVTCRNNNIMEVKIGRDRPKVIEYVDIEDRMDSIKGRKTAEGKDVDTDESKSDYDMIAKGFADISNVFMDTHLNHENKNCFMLYRKSLDHHRLSMEDIFSNKFMSNLYQSVFTLECIKKVQVMKHEDFMEHGDKSTDSFHMMSVFLDKNLKYNNRNCFSLYRRSLEHYDLPTKGLFPDGCNGLQYQASFMAECIERVNDDYALDEYDHIPCDTDEVEHLIYSGEMELIEEVTENFIYDNLNQENTDCAKLRNRFYENHSEMAEGKTTCVRYMYHTIFMAMCRDWSSFREATDTKFRQAISKEK